MNPAPSVFAAFANTYGEPAALAWSAPGRVNLIGEHTDYNDGFVLPFALRHRTNVAVARHHTPEWTVWSAEGRDRVTFGVSDLVPGAVGGWAGYVAGIVWVLREAGLDVPYARLAVTSDVPVGAGLSSSAALECATLAALLQLADGSIAVDRWPALAQRAENEYVGMPCGIMDQAAATLCRAGHALFLDCRSLAVEHVPFDLSAAGLGMLVIDTNAPHRHADGEYADRRASCEAAAAALGVPALRDVTDLDGALARIADPVTRRRVRHVVTENRRVLQTVDLLHAGRPAEIGPLLTASHASLRDDYEVTVPELDAAVDSALKAGALGARMTGGGFGGCVIALVPATEAGRVASAVSDAFDQLGFVAPTILESTPHGAVAAVRPS